MRGARCECGPTFPSQGDLAGLPGIPAGVRDIAGPGMYGPTPDQRRTGLDADTWARGLAASGHGSYTVTVIHDRVIAGEQALAHAAEQIADRHAQAAEHNSWRWLTYGHPYVETAYDRDDPTDVARLLADHGINPDQPDHRLAWVRLDGLIEHDLLGEGREGQPWTAVDLLCECDFTFQIMDNGGVCVFMRPGIDADGCIYRAPAARLRVEEVRVDLGITPGLMPTPQDLADLRDRALAGEWLGQTSGSAFWGSNLYLQLIGDLYAVPMRGLWRVAAQAEAAKLLSMEGAVLLPYRELMPGWTAAWERSDGIHTVLIQLPDNAACRGVARLVTIAADGTETIHESVQLMHEPIFGVDAEDAAMLDAHAEALLTRLRTHGGAHEPA